MAKSEKNFENFFENVRGDPYIFSLFFTIFLIVYELIKSNYSHFL